MSDRLFAVQFKFKQLSFFEFGRVPKADISKWSILDR
jgi:hypothetical protein